MEKKRKILLCLEIFSGMKGILSAEEWSLLGIELEDGDPEPEWTRAEQAALLFLTNAIAGEE